MQAHAIVLDLPTQLCANRAAARVDHEGGLDGPGAKSAVYRLGSQLVKAGRPQTSEGLSSVMVGDPPLQASHAARCWPGNFIVSPVLWLAPTPSAWKASGTHCSLTRLHTWAPVVETVWLILPALRGPLIVVQVCNSEADVKRALQVWSEYKASGKQPLEQYQRSTPAKRTLATLWGKHGSTAAANNAGGAGQTSSSRVQMTPAHAGSSLRGKATSEPAPPPEVQSPPASIALSSSSAQPDGEESMAGKDRTPAVEPGAEPSEPLHNSSAIAEKDSGRPGRSRQGADTGNAFAILMSRAKQPAEAPPSTAPGHISARRQQYQPNSWKDALRQVAVAPDRYDH